MWSFLSHNPFKHLSRKLLVRSKQVAIYEACIIGLVSGLAAVSLKQTVAWLGGLRIQASYQYPAWLVLPLIGLIGGSLAGWLVERLAPESAGSGIPQVKAALANVPIALNLRVALVKLLGVILTLGAGLNLGRQGPTVQVGAALAAQLSRWIPTSPAYRRQMIAAGAAAGLAAGFNAPIAGVLFVVEEFLRDFSGLTLGSAILASFIGAVVSRLLGGGSLGLDPQITSFRVSSTVHDLPFLLILGALAGIFGALFGRGIFLSLNFNRYILRLGLPWRVGLAGLVTGIVVAFLPGAFRDSSGLQEFLSTGQASWRFTLLAFVVKFLLTLIAYGSGAPGGIFAPSLILGASLGYLVGFNAQQIDTFLGDSFGLPTGVTPPSTYALAGMGAFFSAVTRGPITAIVIVFEMTTDFNLVLPLMIGSVVAYLIADRIASGSFYNQLLAWNGINLEQELAQPQGQWGDLSAADVMQRRVETLSSDLSLQETRIAFSRSHHRGFPVVEKGRLVGIVTQGDLSDPSRCPTELETAVLADIMTPEPVTVAPEEPLSQVLYLLNRFKLSRLPVTEGHKLVGIITRADIIRAESEQISGEARHQVATEPSYTIYQTRSPATGKGRLLVPLSNPQTAPVLLKIAFALARYYQYELECLNVILVPRSSIPSETPVRTTQSRRLLQQAERLGRALDAPVHTQIRVAHDAVQPILETLRERHIDLMVMGWKGSTSTTGRVFGDSVDAMIRQAACQLVLVKLAEPIRFDRWLVPIAGGPNSDQALQLLPALVSLSHQPDVQICQVYDTTPEDTDTKPLQQKVKHWSETLNCPISSRPIWHEPVPDAVIQLAWQEHRDVIMLGASQEGLLKQVIKGNIPEAIARHSNRTVILVRGAFNIYP
jgi:CIC family chloride channel protein